MNSDTIATLQSVADAIAPGLARVTLDLRDEPIYEPDERPSRRGRNRLARWVPCDACKATGETVDAEGFPVVCPSCSGHKGDDVETRYPHPHVRIDIGHNVVTEIGALDGKGRVDKRRERTVEELTALVRAQVGNAAMETLASNREIADSKRVQILADAAVASGCDRATVARHVARRRSLANVAAGNPAVIVATIAVAKCTGCGARTSSENAAAVRAWCAGGKCALCGAVVNLSSVRRLADGTETEA